MIYDQILARNIATGHNVNALFTDEDQEQGMFADPDEILVRQLQNQREPSSDDAGTQPGPIDDGLLPPPSTPASEGPRTGLPDNQLRETAEQDLAIAAARTTERLPCVACNDEKPLSDIFWAPCGHAYCHECLDHLFESSANDQTLWPPRCCRQHIGYQSVKAYLTSATCQDFEMKSVEWATKNRTYCHDPSCSSFIPPSRIQGEVATCIGCQKMTCTICKGASHSNECPHDLKAQEILNLAKEEGWQRCTNCKHVVALSYGCNHIT